MDFYLNSKAQGKTWGPFATPMRAWRFLFYRAYTSEDVALYRGAGWSVTRSPLFEVRCARY